MFAMADPNLFLWIKLFSSFGCFNFSGVTAASELASEICHLFYIGHPFWCNLSSDLQSQDYITMVTDPIKLRHISCLLKYSTNQMDNWPQTSHNMSWVVGVFTQNLQSFHGSFLLSILSHKKQKNTNTSHTQNPTVHRVCSEDLQQN